MSLNYFSVSHILTGLVSSPSLHDFLDLEKWVQVGKNLIISATPGAEIVKHQGSLQNHQSFLFGGSFPSTYKYAVISLLKKKKVRLSLDPLFLITCHSSLLIFAEFSAKLFIISVPTSPFEVLHHPLGQLLWSPPAFPVLSNFPFSATPDTTISHSLPETLSSLASRTQPSLLSPHPLPTSLAPPPGPSLLFILLTEVLEWRTPWSRLPPYLTQTSIFKYNLHANNT